jgi:hypothetical protein
MTDEYLYQVREQEGIETAYFGVNIFPEILRNNFFFYPVAENILSYSCEIRTVGLRLKERLLIKEMDFLSYQNIQNIKSKK